MLIPALANLKRGTMGRTVLRVLLAGAGFTCLTTSVAEATQPPNVVLIMLDDARADLLSPGT